MRTYVIFTRGGVACLVTAMSADDAMEQWAELDTPDKAVMARLATRAEIAKISKARVHDYRRRCAN